MKKKILCLALCVIMVVASLVGCQEENKQEIMNAIGKEASKGALTVTVMLLAEEKVSTEQEELVEAAVNEHMSYYNIRLDLKYYTEDKYYDTLEENLEMMYKVSKGEVKAATNNKESETKYLYIDENGLPTVYYPPNPDYHVDIFYFGGYDRYLKYKSIDINGDGVVDTKDGDGYFADVSTEVSTGKGKGLQNGISAVLFEGVKGSFDGKVNMVPCNNQMGEYSYLVFNKDVLENTAFTAEQLSDFSNGMFSDFMRIVSDASYSSAYDLIYSAEDDVPAELKNYTVVTEKSDKPFVIEYIKGDITLPQKYYDEYGDKYELVVFEKPVVERDDLCENAFGVCRYTNEKAQTALVLAELYTNKEIINLLAHGVEGTNYTWVDSGVYDENYEPYQVLKKITDDKDLIYDMDIAKIGNSAEAYPTVDDDPRRTEYILDQNSDASFYYSYIAVNKDALAIVNKDLKDKFTVADMADFSNGKYLAFLKIVSDPTKTEYAAYDLIYSTEKVILDEFKGYNVVAEKSEKPFIIEYIKGDSDFLDEYEDQYGDKYDIAVVKNFA